MPGKTQEIVYTLGSIEKDVFIKVLELNGVGSLQGEDAVWDNDTAADEFMCHFQATLDDWRIQARTPGDATWDVLVRHGSRLLVKISKHAHVIPSTLFVSNVSLDEQHAVSGGAYADIWRAHLDGRRVALKRLRIFTGDADYNAMISTFTQEALTWRQLNHIHLLPFLGVDIRTFGGVPCMVAPWMRYGSILKFLKEKPPTLEVLQRLIAEIGDGLVYLHRKLIVHGDLRGANVLIDERQHVRLADFGLSRIASNTATHTSGVTRGAVRWMAPEQLLPPPGGNEQSCLTVATDIYSAGCLVLELFTLRVPFYYLPNDLTVLLRVTQGEHPARPPAQDCIVNLPEETWLLLQRCWTREPTQRASVSKIVRHFMPSTLSTPSTPSSRAPRRKGPIVAWLHPLLQSSSGIFFDLSAPKFSPCKLEDGNRRGAISPIASSVWEEKVFRYPPPNFRLLIKIEKISQWPLLLHDATAERFTVGYLLGKIWWHLRHQVTREEWDTLASTEDTKTAQAFKKRCRSNQTEVADGVKRVDYLHERVVFRGFLPKSYNENVLTVDLQLVPHP